MPRAVPSKQEFGRLRLPPQALKNMYLRPHPETADQYIRETVPALTDFVTAGLGDGPIRGMFFQQGVLNSLLYVVSGNTLYSVDRDGNPTSLGTISGGNTPVELANDATYLVIVADPEAWTYDLTNGLQKITDTDFVSVTDVAYLNGYFFFTRRDSGEFIWSASQDPTSYDALDFATAEAYGDNNVGLIADSDQMYFFGTDTIEIHNGTSNANLPLAKRPGGIRTTGCAARDTIVREYNTIFFLGSDRAFYRLANADVPQIISNGQVEEALRDLSEDNLRMCRAYSHRWDGHSWVYLEIPTKGTFVYDIKMENWFERSSWEKTLFIGTSPCRAYSRQFIGDRNAGKIYELSSTAYADSDTGVLEREITVNFPTDLKGARADKIYLDCTVGDGLQTGQGSDPLVMFTKSVDGGRTFTGALTRSLGVAGNYANKVVVRAQGRYDSPGLITKWRVTDPVPFTVWGARINE